MKKGLLFLVMFFGLLSCKRQDVFGEVEPNTSRVMAEFTDARTGTSVTSDFSAQPTEVELTELRLEPRSVAKGETRVKVIINSTVLNAYNEANGTAYQMPPPGAFVLSKGEYTLSKGQRQAMVKAQLLPSALVNGSYAVGLSIAEMSQGDISKTAHDVVVFISIKNSYDGIYNVRGYSNIPGTAFTGNFVVPCGEELALATSGVSSVFIDPGQPVYSAGGFTYISNLLPDISFNSTTNKVSAVSPRSGSLGFIFPFDAAYDSRYDPATKTVYVKYGVAPTGSGRYVIDTFSFCRPR